MRAGFLAERQFAMAILSAFGLLAIVLAGIGLYGVLTYLVQLRVMTSHVPGLQPAEARLLALAAAAVLAAAVPIMWIPARRATAIDPMHGEFLRPAHELHEQQAGDIRACHEQRDDARDREQQEDIRRVGDHVALQRHDAQPEPRLVVRPVRLPELRGGAVELCLGFADRRATSQTPPLALPRLRRSAWPSCPCRHVSITAR